MEKLTVRTTNNTGIKYNFFYFKLHNDLQESHCNQVSQDSLNLRTVSDICSRKIYNDATKGINGKG